MARLGRFLLVIVVFFVAIAVALWFLGWTWADIRNFPTPRNAVIDGGEELRVPLPAENDGRRLPVVEPGTDGIYEFMFVDGGDPVLYDPCQPVNYVVNNAGQPHEGEQLVHEAVQEIEAATGLDFVFEGTTNEIASFDRRLLQVDRYGERFAPVIIGWSDAERIPELADAVTGIGGSSSVTGAFGPERFLTSGVVILDSGDIAEMLGTEANRLLARAVVMHELGHVVGLAHIDDPMELMNPTNRTLVDWGPGDLAGLAIAGAGPCQIV